MLTIDDLPDEVLALSFSKLRLPDRKRVRQVCKGWLEVCNSGIVTKHEVIKINKDELNQFTIPRCNLNLRVYNMEDPRKYLKFWQKHGNSVKSLKLSDVQLRSSELFEIIICCPNLGHLTVSNGGEEAASTKTNFSVRETAQLNSLLSLNFNHVDLTKGNKFWELTKNLPKLKRLQFKHCEVTGNVQAVRDAVMSLILRVSLSLTELIFTDCYFVTNEFLETILEKIGHQLTGLYLSSDECLPEFSKKLVKLENVQLSYPISNEDTLSDFFMSFRNLKLISLNETLITDNVLSIVAGLEHLKSLDIGARFGSSVRLTVDGILKAFGQKQHPTLIDIRLTNLVFLTDDVLSIILPQLTNLECLDLKGCENISDQSVSAIVTNCKQLKYLSLDYCFQIRSIMEPVSINSLQNLVHLNLFHCQSLNRGIVYELKLGLLKTVELGKMPLSEESLKALMLNCPSLERVHLSDSHEDEVEMYEASFQPCKFSLDDESLKLSVFQLSTRFI